MCPLGMTLARRAARTDPDSALRSGRDDRGRALREVYERLLAAYGPQHWWPGETAFEVIVGAILTQSAAWSNVEKAIGNLKAAGVLSPGGLHSLDEAEIARLIRPSGYFNAKARKLKAFVEMVHARFAGDLGSLLALPADELRRVLLSTHGIGPETADSIVLYAAGKPSFVIDAYTRRMFSRIGIRPSRSRGFPASAGPRGVMPSHSRPAHDGYEAWRAMFMEPLPPDAALFNEYHALVVAHGKAVCRKTPLCGRCVLRDGCETGRGLAPG